MSRKVINVVSKKKVIEKTINYLDNHDESAEIWVLDSDTELNYNDFLGVDELVLTLAVADEFIKAKLIKLPQPTFEENTEFNSYITFVGVAFDLNLVSFVINPNNEWKVKQLPWQL